MIVKVCGMCDSENLKALIELNIDWVGLIFYDASARNVEADKVAAENMRLLQISDFGIKKVGVFVNAEESAIIDKANIYNLSFIQLHGSESAKTCARIKQKGFSVIKAFSIDEHFDFNRLMAYAPHCDYFLFDTKGELPGGNGFTFNWDLLSKYKLDIPFILSGGIGPAQASQLKTFHHPKFAGIDLNSKFETIPGIKNIAKLKNFIEDIHSVNCQ